MRILRRRRTHDEPPFIPPRQVMVRGQDIAMLCEPTRLVIVEQRSQPVRMTIPLRSCTKAHLADEPGLPGAALLRLILTVRVGTYTSFDLTLWFPVEHRPLLTDLVHQVSLHRPPPAAPTSPGLPLLEVTQAPDSDEWLVFRAAPSGAEVLAPHRLVTQPTSTGEVR